MKRAVFVIGDSISIQYGPHLQRMLEGFCDYDRKSGEEEALRNLDNPLGANGGDSSMVLAYLQALEAGGRKFDVLMVNCGLHDIKKLSESDSAEQQVPPDRYAANLREIAAIAGRIAKRLVWVNTTPVDFEQHRKRTQQFYRRNEDVLRCNETAEAIMAEHGARVFDLYRFTANVGGELYCDHVHFHERVRELQAAFLAGALIADLQR
ncbi:SGNH/GDSL hydrolase family protein [Paenibacillus cymbidii]|uniref:SGNH/GDSL hydrolase family protein n=1 Tax=Paenibacillus cymbidii TaxID=1639034 RepID=UPI0014369B0B|nr:SGNH/GDSL hydrolase family protein [Paenibacillus cymbidii]